MAQYPIDNESDLFDAVNYLLSGPTSIGQNFQGMSSVAPGADTTATVYTQDYDNGVNTTVVTGSIAPPWTSLITKFTPPEINGYRPWSVIPNSIVYSGITNIVPFGPPLEDTVTVTLAAPFDPRYIWVGKNIKISGVNPAAYNRDYEVDSWTLSGGLVNTITLRSPVVNVSSGGTVGNITGTGPWTAELSNMDPWAYVLNIGDEIAATDDTGSLGTGGVYTVASIDGNTQITFTATGGTTPLAGDVTNVVYVWPPYVAGGTLAVTASVPLITNITSPGSNTLTVDLTFPVYPGGSNPDEPQPSRTPFTLGQDLEIQGVTPAMYDGRYMVTKIVYNDPPWVYNPVLTTPGLISVTLTLYSWTTATWATPYTSGGYLYWHYAYRRTPTDCNAVVTVTGPTDRVFISNLFSAVMYWYAANGASADLQVQINRYKSIRSVSLPDGTTNTTPDFPSAQANYDRIYNGYLWQFDKTLLDLTYNIGLSAPAGFEAYKVEQNYNNIIDNPGIGQYWYMLDIVFRSQPAGPFLPNSIPLTMKFIGLRSFTAQVIKQ